MLIGLKKPSPSCRQHLLSVRNSSATDGRYVEMLGMTGGAAQLLLCCIIPETSFVAMREGEKGFSEMGWRQQKKKKSLKVPDFFIFVVFFSFSLM